jgi:ABC-type Fe3+ transport system permease subunit
MLDSGFWAGFVAGIVMAGILGFVLQQLRFHRKRMEALGRPQVVTTKTDKTPRQVLWDSVAGGCGCVFWTVVLIAVLVVVIWLAFQSLS